MNNNVVLRMLYLGVVLAVLTVPSFAAGADLSKWVQDIENKVKSEVSYELGSKIQLQLVMGEAVRLICKKNPYGLKEILIFSNRRSLFQYHLWESGNRSGGGRNLQEKEYFKTVKSDTKNDPTGKWKLKFPLLFLGRPRIPIAVSEKWKVAGEKIVLEYQIVTDPDEILRKQFAQDKAASGFKKLKKAVDRLRKKTGVDLSFKSGETIQFIVPTGRSAKLDCGKLGIGLKDVLLWPRGKTLHMYCAWANGKVSYTQKPLKKKQTLWVPSPPSIALDLKWKKVPKGLRVEVIAETNEDKIAEIMRRFRKKYSENKKLVDSHERQAGFIRSASRPCAR